MAKRRGRNQGSIWIEGDKHRAAVTLNGKRITKTFRTIQECNDWIREMQNQRDLGLTIVGSKITVEQFLKDWLAIHRTSLEPKSGERYAQLARDYIFPSIGKHLLRDLRLEHIEKLYQDLLQIGVSVRNIHYVHSLLHRSLNDALKRGLVGFNASHGARLPKMNHREMEILNEEEAIQFLIAAENNRHLVLYHLAIKTGMRQGELLGLKWSDLDWNKGTVRVQRQVIRVTGRGMVFKPPKTKAGRRTIQLGEETLQVLRKHLAQQRVNIATVGERWQNFGLMFPSTIGTPQSPSNLSKGFKVLLRAAGLKVIRFHDLRHTAASLMLNHGAPVLVVSKILGHSKPSTTLDIYGHLIPIMQDSVASLMDELVTPIPVEMGETAGIDTFPNHS